MIKKKRVDAWCCLMLFFRLKWRIFASKSLGHENWGLLFLGVEVCFVFELEGRFIRRGGRGIERKGRRRRRAARVSRELVPSLRLARFLFLLVQVLGI